VDDSRYYIHNNNIDIEFCFEPESIHTSSITAIAFGEINRINHIVPEWYLLTIYRFIKLLPSQVLGLLLFVLAMVVLMQLVSHSSYSVVANVSAIAKSSNALVRIIRFIAIVLAVGGARLPVVSAVTYAKLRSVTLLLLSTLTLSNACRCNV
jgi:quinol-cytochrome oxidoreductase complex cytochrome b subunit